MVNETRQRVVSNWQRQAWLTEYEVCQSYVNSLGNQFWISMTIIFSINIAALAGTTYAIINSNGLLPRNTLSIILILGIGLILISNFLKFWQKRVNFLIRISNDRMFEIERKLGMEKTRIIRGLNAYYKYDLDNNTAFSNLDYRTRIITTKAISRSNITAPFWWPLEKGFWGKAKQSIKALFWFLFTFILDIWSDVYVPIFKKPKNVEYKPDTVNVVISILLSVIPILWILVIILAFTIYDC